MQEFKNIVYDVKERLDKIFAPRIPRDTAPTQAPTNSRDQIVVYSDSSSKSVYIFNDGSFYKLPLDGWSGTFTNGDGNTVTVDNGIITDVT